MVTVSIVDWGVRGHRRHVIADVTFDGDYEEGGEALPSELCGLTRILDVAPRFNGTHLPAWDAANERLVMYEVVEDRDVGAVLAEVEDETNLSRVVVRCEVVGY